MAPSPSLACSAYWKRSPKKNQSLWESTHCPWLRSYLGYASFQHIRPYPHFIAYLHSPCCPLSGPFGWYAQALWIWTQVFRNRPHCPCLHFCMSSTWCALKVWIRTEVTQRGVTGAILTNSSWFFFHGIAWKKNLTYISLKQPLRCFPENWWEFSWSEIICWWYFYGFFTQLGCCGWQLLATASADLHRAVSFKPGCWLADMPALCHPNSSN